MFRAREAAATKLVAAPSPLVKATSLPFSYDPIPLATPSESAAIPVTPSLLLDAIRCPKKFTLRRLLPTHAQPALSTNDHLLAQDAQEFNQLCARRYQLMYSSTSFRIASPSFPDALEETSRMLDWYFNKYLPSRADSLSTEPPMVLQNPAFNVLFDANKFSGQKGTRRKDAALPLLELRSRVPLLSYSPSSRQWRLHIPRAATSLSTRDKLDLYVMSTLQLFTIRHAHELPYKAPGSSFHEIGPRYIESFCSLPQPPQPSQAARHGIKTSDTITIAHSELLCLEPRMISVDLTTHDRRALNALIASRPGGLLREAFNENVLRYLDDGRQFLCVSKKKTPQTAAVTRDDIFLEWALQGAPYLTSRSNDFDVASAIMAFSSQIIADCPPIVLLQPHPSRPPPSTPGDATTPGQDINVASSNDIRLSSTAAADVSALMLSTRSEQPVLTLAAEAISTPCYRVVLSPQKAASCYNSHCADCTFFNGNFCRGVMPTIPDSAVLEESDRRKNQSQEGACAKERDTPGGTATKTEKIALSKRDRKQQTAGKYVSKTAKHTGPGVYDNDEIVFTLPGARSTLKRELLKQGITTAASMARSHVKLTDRQTLYLRAINESSVMVNPEAVRRWFDGLRYPVIALDFEAAGFAIPPFPKLRPYGVLPFQYSSRTYRENILAESPISREFCYIGRNFNPFVDPRPSLGCSIASMISEARGGSAGSQDLIKTPGIAAAQATGQNGKRRRKLRPDDLITAPGIQTMISRSPHRRYEVRHPLGTHGCIVAHNVAYERMCFQSISLVLDDARDRKCIAEAVLQHGRLWAPKEMKEMFESLVFVDSLKLINDGIIHPGARGSGSLKKLVPALLPHMEQYTTLSIQEGQAAYAEYRNWHTDVVRRLPKDNYVKYNAERERLLSRYDGVREALLKYCGLDTLLMCEIIREVGRIASLATGPPDQAGWVAVPLADVIATRPAKKQPLSYK